MLGQEVLHALKFSWTFQSVPWARAPADRAPSSDHCGFGCHKYSNLNQLHKVSATTYLNRKPGQSAAETIVKVRTAKIRTSKIWSMRIRSAYVVSGKRQGLVSCLLQDDCHKGITYIPCICTATAVQLQLTGLVEWEFDRFVGTSFPLAH